MPSVIYPDEKNASYSDYSHLKPNEMLVSSIFHTLQGEGPYAGHPATFVRLSGCNLGGKGVNGPGCDFCDTDFRLANGKIMTFEEIYVAIDTQRRAVELWSHNRDDNLIVITGGEPSLQRNLPSLIDLLNTLTFHVQVESNGMFPMSYPQGERFTLVVSPKVPSNRSTYLPIPELIYNQADCLKFVISADPESPYHFIPDWGLKFAEEKEVYLSPMAVYAKAPNKEKFGEMSEIVTSAWDGETYDIVKTYLNYSYAALLCIRYGLILSIQQHIFAVIP